MHLDKRCGVCGRGYPPPKVRRILLPAWAPSLTAPHIRRWFDGLCPDCVEYYRREWRFIVA